MRFTRYDRWENQLGSVKPISAEHEEALDGTDTLTLTTFDYLEKGDRLLWRDADGTWHEHIVDSLQRVHDSGGRAISRVVAINSVCELFGDHIDHLSIASCNVSVAVSSLVYEAGSRWSARSDLTSIVDSFTFEFTSAREGINQIIDQIGTGEIWTEIMVDDIGVITRRVNIIGSRGSSTITRRFTYGRNVTGVRRIVENTDPITALYAYGKASEDIQGNVTRLGISDVNGGVLYVEDTTARDSWGRWNRDKTAKVHRFGYYIDENCTDATFLKTQAQRQLANLSQPEITYEADVIDVEHALAGVALGDMVDVVDTAFSPAIRMRQRVTRIKRDLMLGTATGTVTIGKRRNFVIERYVEAAEEKKADESTTSTKTKLETMAGSGSSSIDDVWAYNLAQELNANPDYLADLADALTSGGYISGGDAVFPVYDSTTNKNVALAVKSQSSHRGLVYQERLGGTLSDILWVRAADAYGSFYVYGGASDKPIGYFFAYNGANTLYLASGADTLNTLGDHGLLEIDGTTGITKLQAAKGLGSTAYPLARLSLNPGTAQLGVFGHSGYSTGDAYLSVAEDVAALVAGKSSRALVQVSNNDSTNKGGISLYANNQISIQLQNGSTGSVVMTLDGSGNLSIDASKAVTIEGKTISIVSDDTRGVSINGQVF